LAELDKVTAGVDDAIAKIEKAFPGRPLVALTALAEGADRLIAGRILTRPLARLAAVLPLQRRDYSTDFQSAESKRDFLALLRRADKVIDLPRRVRPEAYEASGRYIVEHSDVLVVAWDGQNEQGQGGTAQIVAYARQWGLPIAWVRAGNRRPGTREPTSLGNQQGQVTFENFPRCRFRGRFG
jgi:hypothetical protein